VFTGCAEGITDLSHTCVVDVRIEVSGEFGEVEVCPGVFAGNADAVGDDGVSAVIFYADSSFEEGVDLVFTADGGGSISW